MFAESITATPPPARRPRFWHWLPVAAGVAMFGAWVSLGSAAVPAGCYEVTSGTVLDTKTTLIWQRAADPGSYSWGDAQAYCATLDLDGAVWRLPSIKELLTIVDFSRADPAVDLGAFPDTPSDYFWSSSAVAASSTAAWGVSFNKGSAGTGPLDFTGRVRCVRP